MTRHLTICVSFANEKTIKVLHSFDPFKQTSKGEYRRHSTVGGLVSVIRVCGLNYFE